MLTTDWSKSYDQSLLCISMRLRMSAATASTSNSQVLCFSTSSKTKELQKDLRQDFFLFFFLKKKRTLLHSFMHSRSKD